MKKLFIFCCLAFGLLSWKEGVSQEKREVTLEDVFKKGIFRQKSVSGINWMKDGRFYTSLEHTKKADYVIKYNITTGAIADTLVNGETLYKEGQTSSLRFTSYTLSADEDKILIATEREPIYRRSSKAFFFIYDLKSKALSSLAQGDKQSFATFSPDGSKVAFVRNNNLYYVTLNDMKEHAVTTDGKWNHIINGSSDWVYEEEFSIAKAFFWSPDSKLLAYYTFDESDVKEYNMQVWGNLYPKDYKFKYPKAGEKNSKIDISVFHLTKGEKTKMDIGTETDIYIPRLYWTPNSETLSIIRMNRLQNKLEILHGNVNTGSTKVILTEKSDTYVDIDFTDDLTYLSDNKTFIKSSEQDRFKHIYWYKMDGSLIRQITKGNWEVNSMEGIDQKRKLIYYLSTEDSPLERQLYVINFNGKGKRKLSSADGWNSVNFSRDFKYFINYHSTSTDPLTVSLHRAPTGKIVKTLEKNEELRERLSEFDLGEKSFFKLKTTGGTELNAYMIKPSNFDENKKYPVLMYVYGGPGSQMVTNRWGGSRESWYQVLAAKGYIIVCVDNRGTGARGRDFKHVTYGRLGKYEVEDQIEGAKYLASLPFVDKDRIGIWGWSYGGYMSSLSLFLGADYFKTAIAVAPVTNWRFYDTIYTERYLKTPQENPVGYDAFSPVTHAEKLKGNFFLIHGTGDDNVHFQNAVTLVDALVDANKQFRSFYYPNRNHGIYGGNTTFHLYNMMTDYLLKKL
ncbi:S9 family peptidase [Xanthovirga aplysinae]|uniref:S9 family peptidase n=1 Tax=Xanthovirga aplysinae TaxID=2529853 RepID=UPI0012BBDF8D|nr:S9 family peptidase [Xanthovirga aplysinae]MTI29694.1 S9 family peptidase [Xanthovirga aplysinae]